jgi:uncharacterized protein (DUF433 family)
MLPAEELLTPQETSIVSGVPVRTIYKVARERLPDRLVVRRGDKLYFTPTAALCFHIDRGLPKDVPVAVRKRLYVLLGRDPKAGRVEHRTHLFSYVIDAAAAGAEIAEGLLAYRDARRVIVEDPEVQGGAATFKGTRLLVHNISEQLKAGATPAELKADYPNLTDEMLAAAPLYARANPKRGRPKAPAWREGEPTAMRRHATPRP